jgi:hypothetical protein
MIAGAIGLFAGVSHAAPADTSRPSAEAAREPLERRPYKIRAWIVADPAARIDSLSREILLGKWRGMIRRFVGPVWDIEVARDDGPLGTATINALDAKSVRAQLAGFDKGWMLYIAPGTGDGVDLWGREMDVATGRLGLVCKRSVPYPADFGRGLFQLTLDIFSPFAEIGESSGGGVTLTVQGGAILPADPVGRIVSVGTVFLPIRVFQRPNGSITRIDPIKWSYLRVQSVEGPIAHCGIASGLRDPLSKRVVGKNRLIALGMKPSAIPTRFRFMTSGPDSQPAAGYTLTVRDFPSGPPHDVGTTDREGRIVLQPGFADGLVVYRLLAGNIEPLVEFPGMPGETPDERVIKINPLLQTVTLETQLNALKDEVVDMVATRARLEARLKARAAGDAWDDVRATLDEFGKLKPRDSFVERLTKLKETAAKQQAELKKPVLTKTAQAQLADTEALIDRYLDDDAFRAYENAWKESRELAKAEAQKKDKQAKIAEGLKAAEAAKAKSATAAAKGTAAATPPGAKQGGPPPAAKPGAPKAKKGGGPPGNVAF